MNQDIDRWFTSHRDEIITLSDAIWQNPEAPMEEYRACAWTGDYLEKYGFGVKIYHCKHPDRKPNTVVASWGSGSPAVGIIGEYDALAGLGQEALPYHAPKPGYGHGCGHSMTTPACASAAIALKEALQKAGLPGQIRFLACPAEETGEGKVYMLQHGDFEGLDCCLSWHPMGRDMGPEEGSMLAIMGMYFEFFGTAAHAAAMPEMGRSALDAAELMNVGVQYLREHVSSDVRIHYIIERGGDSPNIVPDYARSYYLVRAKTMARVNEVMERIKKVAQGAAVMTETRWEYTFRSAGSETYIVHDFNRFCLESAKKVPPLSHTAEEEEFAQTLYRNILGKEPEGSALPAGLAGLKGVSFTVPASTDAGYLTQRIPTSRLFGTGILRNIPMHHWGVTATAGMSIGHKAILYAGRVVAQAGFDIFQNAGIIDSWKAELSRVVAGMPLYTPLLPDKPGMTGV
jgi:aminobenzoyl-glutamate utilization protein B